MRRVVSVWLPYLATDRLARGKSGPTDRPRPLATMSTGGTRRVLAADRAARAAGVRPGITVADAQAVAPDVRLIPADPAADRAFLERLADWCVAFTPWSAVDESEPDGMAGGGLWLDITGCAHLWDGEEALLAEVTGRLKRFGLAARAAVADTTGAAWAWARFGTASPVLAPGGQRAALKGLPNAALRLDPATVTGLARLGLKTIGDLYALPRPTLTSRFGPVLLERLDQALGRQDEPISPRAPTEVQWVHLAFAEPIAKAEDVAAATRHLLDRLAAQLERRRLGVRRLELAAFRVDASRQVLAVGTSRPSRDPRHLFRLLADPLAGLDCGFGVEMLVLTAAEAGSLEDRQTDFVQPGETPNAEALDRLFDSLGNRLGFGRVVRFELRESHLPERAVRSLGAAAAAAKTLRHSRESGNPEFPAHCSAPLDPRLRGDDDSIPPNLRRPLRLFPRPEAVEAVAPVPDSPPLLFRWRRQTHRIVRAEGPERLAAEWWRQNAPDRDYYCVEDEAGRRFWLYREGHYGGRVAPRWFLHGVFP